MKNLNKAIIIILLLLLPAAGIFTSQNKKDKPDGDTLYKQNCSRCHIVPQFKFASILNYSAGQKKTVVMHMRVRANLTEKEANAIIEFLTK